MTLRTIKISGPFTEQDLVEFMALLRRIDQAHPKGLFTMNITYPDATMDDGERLLRELLGGATQ